MIKKINKNVGCSQFTLEHILDTTKPSGLMARLKAFNLVGDFIAATSFLPENTKSTIRIWHLRNKIYEVPLCKNPDCKNRARWYENKYGNYCSRSCGTKCSYEKYKATCLEKYGAISASSNLEVKNKIKLTNIKRYGYEQASLSPIIKEKLSKISAERKNTAENKEQYKKIFFENNKHLYTYPYELIDYPCRGQIRIRHHICNNIFDSNVNIWSSRKRQNIEQCTICKPIDKTPKSSSGEGQIYDFIKQIYNGEIQIRNRKIIYPYEIDIYIPILNLGIEYNGDYWHANPNFYKSNDVIWRQTAKQIWERDTKKKIRCEKHNIHLFIVWESDWLNNKNLVKAELREYLYGNKK